MVVKSAFSKTATGPENCMLSEKPLFVFKLRIKKIVKQSSRNLYNTGKVKGYLKLYANSLYLRINEQI